MPTRRIFELIIVTGMLGRPVMGSIRLWGMRTMGATAPGTAMHTVAEVAVVLA